MKKLFTLIAALAFTAMANAQLHFVHDGKNIESGSTFVSSHLNEVMKEIGFLELEPQLFIKSDVDGEVVVEGKSTNDVSFQLCYGTMCLSGKDLQVYGAIAANKAEDLQIHCGEFGTPLSTITTCKVSLKAYYKGKPGEAITLNLVMSNDPNETASVEGVELDENAPAKTYDFGGRTSKGKGFVIVKQGSKVKKVAKQ